jgi:hypothetical protein
LDDKYTDKVGEEEGFERVRKQTNQMKAEEFELSGNFRVERKAT